MPTKNTPQIIPAKLENQITPSGVVKKVVNDFLVSDIRKEQQIEDWLVGHFDELGLDAALIGRQVPVENNKDMDMFAITRTSRLCVVELKRDRANRDVFIQVLDFARLLSGFLKEELDALCAQAKNAKVSLSDVYQEAFQRNMPKCLRAPLLVVVAEEFDDAARHMALFLNQVEIFHIQLIRYQAEKEGGLWKFSFQDEVLPENCLRVTGKMPDQTIMVRIEETSEMLWNDCLENHLLPVGDEAAKQIEKLRAKGPVSLLVYLDQHGYVASGSLEDRALPQDLSTPPEKTVLPVKWDFKVPIEKAVFLNKDAQPRKKVQIVTDAEDWAIVMGMLRFNAQHLRDTKKMKQKHGAEKRPFHRKTHNPNPF